MGGWPLARSPPSRPSAPPIRPSAHLSLLRWNRQLHLVARHHGDRLRDGIATCADWMQLEAHLWRDPHDVRRNREHLGGETVDHAKPDARPRRQYEDVHVRKVLIFDFDGRPRV